MENFLDSLNPKRAITLILTFILALVLLNAGCSTFRTVPSGSVGVVTHFGATTGETLQPGLHVVTPWVTAVENMDTQTHAVKATAEAATDTSYTHWWGGKRDEPLVYQSKTNVTVPGELWSRTNIGDQTWVERTR